MDLVSHTGTSTLCPFRPDPAGGDGPRSRRSPGLLVSPLPRRLHRRAALHESGLGGVSNVRDTTRAPPRPAVGDLGGSSDPGGSWASRLPDSRGTSADEEWGRDFIGRPLTRSGARAARKPLTALHPYTRLGVRPRH